MSALKYLVWVDAKNAIPALWERSRDSLEPLEQIRIGLTLLLLEDERAVSLLNKHCFQTEDDAICNACFDAFFFVAPRSASKYYLFELKHAKNEKDSVTMAARLAIKEQYRKALAVLNKLSDSPDPGIRSLTAFGLGFIDTPKSMSLLEKLAQDTNNQDVQKKASEARLRIHQYRTTKHSHRKSKKNTPNPTSNISTINPPHIQEHGTHLGGKRPTPQIAAK